jgi:hypothetical protein
MVDLRIHRAYIPFLGASPPVWAISSPIVCQKQEGASLDAQGTNRSLKIIHARRKESKARDLSRHALT